MKSFEDIMRELESDLDARLSKPVSELTEAELIKEVQELKELEKRALELWFETLRNIPSH